MNEISPVSLVDTLNVIQLARETALARGDQAQADRFKPVVNEIHALITQPQPASTKAQSDAGILGGEDFKQLLAAAQSKPAASTAVSTQNVVERNRMIQAMSAANMTDLEIARQMGISREEVNLVVSIGERGSTGREIIR